MLHPNKDDKTALDLAMDKEMTKIFQLMLDLLEPFDYRMITHMMID